MLLYKDMCGSRAELFHIIICSREEDLHLSCDVSYTFKLYTRKQTILLWKKDYYSCQENPYN